MEDFFDPVYKGCTQPSMAFGVPMVPFVLVTMGFAQIGFLLLIVAGVAAALMTALIYFFLLMWARRTSRHDDQRLLQLMLKARMRGPHRGGSRPVWGAISFGASQPPAKRR